MGLIGRLFETIFGAGKNPIVDVAQVFRENAEAAGIRAADIQTETLSQFAAEFQNTQKGWFDRFMDGVNRIPRPALALGTLALFLTAMFDPDWFAARMAGLALVPDPLWWLLGVIVSFYFGARHQMKGQEFQKGILESMARQIPPHQPPSQPDEVAHSDNAALDDWRRWRQNAHR